jgi:hypothetical protein
MRPSLSYLLLILVLIGCRSEKPSIVSPNIHQTRRDQGLDKLLSVAREKKNTADKRSEAMFLIFETYLPADSSCKEAQDVFGDFDWLSESSFYMFRFQTGYHPLDFKENSTLYGVTPFAKSPQAGTWFIYIRLSGDTGELGLPRFFYSAGPDAFRDIKLLEFALCKPDGSIDIIDSKGKQRIVGPNR